MTTLVRRTGTAALSWAEDLDQVGREAGRSESRVERYKSRVVVLAVGSAVEMVQRRIHGQSHGEQFIAGQCLLDLGDLSFSEALLSKEFQRTVHQFVEQRDVPVLRNRQAERVSLLREAAEGGLMVGSEDGAVGEHGLCPAWSYLAFGHVIAPGVCSRTVMVMTDRLVEAFSEDEARYVRSLLEDPGLDTRRQVLAYESIVHGVGARVRAWDAVRAEVVASVMGDLPAWSAGPVGQRAQRAAIDAGATGDLVEEVVAAIYFVATFTPALQPADDYMARYARRYILALPFKPKANLAKVLSANSPGAPGA